MQFKTFQKHLLQFLFLIITIFVLIILTSRDKLQKQSLTYTFAQFLILVIRSIQTLSIIKYLGVFTRQYNQTLRKLFNLYRKFRTFRRKINSHTLATIKDLGYFLTIYFIKMLLIILSEKSILYRICNVFYYTGQKFTELYIIIYLKDLQQMIFRNIHGFGETSRCSSKYNIYDHIQISNVCTKVVVIVFE